MVQSRDNLLFNSARMVRNILPYAAVLFLMIQVWTYQAASEPINQYNYLTPTSRDSAYQSTTGSASQLTAGSLDFSQVDKAALKEKQVAATSDNDANKVEGATEGIDSSTKVVGAIAAIMGTSMAGGACCGCCLDHKKKGAGCCNCCCNCCDAAISCCCPCCDEKCCKRTCKPCDKSCDCCNGCCVGCPECCGCDPDCGCCRRCRACCPCCCKPRCQDMMEHAPPPPPPQHHRIDACDPHQMGSGHGGEPGRYNAPYMPY